MGWAEPSELDAGAELELLRSLTARLWAALVETLEADHVDPCTGDIYHYGSRHEAERSAGEAIGLRTTERLLLERLEVRA